MSQFNPDKQPANIVDPFGLLGSYIPNNTNVNRDRQVNSFQPVINEIQSIELTGLGFIDLGRELLPTLPWTPLVFDRLKPVTPDINAYSIPGELINAPAFFPGINSDAGVVSWIIFKDSSGKLGDLRIENCLITVTQQPKIIKTSVIGRDGTVKTYVGQDDYKIEIEGFIDNIDGIGKYPRKNVDKLLASILNQGKTLGISIESPYLKIFGNNGVGIDFIVVDNYTLPQEVGGYSQQKFTISAISDYYLDTDIINSPYFA